MHGEAFAFGMQMAINPCVVALFVMVPVSLSVMVPASMMMNVASGDRLAVLSAASAMCADCVGAAGVEPARRGLAMRLDSVFDRLLYW